MTNHLNTYVAWRGRQSAVLSIEGQVNSETRNLFEEKVAAVAAKKPLKVLVNMEKCDYVSSAGIAAIFEFRKKVTEQGGAVSFFRLKPQIQKVFDIVKALPLESVFATEQEADAYLDQVMRASAEAPARRAKH